MSMDSDTKLLRLQGLRFREHVMILQGLVGIGIKMVAFLDRGTPIYAPKLYNPYSGDPQNGT